MSTRIGAAVFLVVVACGRDAEAPSTTTTTAGRVVANEDAVTRLTNARCDREKACNDVGAGKRYADRDACRRELGQNAAVNLRADACESGISVNQLDTCVSGIRNERCGNPIDTLDRIASCRHGRLCQD